MKLCRIRLSLVYHPYPDKIFLFSLVANVNLAKKHSIDYGFKIRTVFIYLGEYLEAYGDASSYTKEKCKTGSNQCIYSCGYI